MKPFDTDVLVNREMQHFYLIEPCSHCVWSSCKPLVRFKKNGWWSTRWCTETGKYGRTCGDLLFSSFEGQCFAGIQDNFEPKGLWHYGYNRNYRWNLPNAVVQLMDPNILHSASPSPLNRLTWLESWDRHDFKVANRALASNFVSLKLPAAILHRPRTTSR